jgi:hypothetical protein
MLSQREIQIKNYTKILSYPSQNAIIKKQTITNAGEDVGKNRRILICCWWEYKLV